VPLGPWETIEASRKIRREPGASRKDGRGHAPTLATSVPRRSPGANRSALTWRQRSDGRSVRARWGAMLEVTS
jgi:hypothetical protein